MENQLPTLQKYNNVLQKIKDNLNYIYVVLMIIINILLSILTVKDGSIGLNYPHTFLGWILWIVQILIQTTIGVLILNSFRRQGIKIGHESIKETYNQYIELTQKKNDETPRSLKEYLTKNALKDSLIKSGILIVISVFVGSVIIGANLNNILALVINIICAICFGIKAMLEAEQYVITELIIWYKIKIKEISEKTISNESEEIKDAKL